MGETMEVNELATANEIEKGKNEKCPFCHVKELGHATNKKPEIVNDKVTSIPANLNCNTSSWHSGKNTKRKNGNLPYTMAQHHLISAMQCYAQVRRIVRMGNLVGYDINNPINGIGLPTTHYTLKYREDGKETKYGDLSDQGKQGVAFSLMEELGAQWHVGHHAFAVTVPKTDVDTWQNEGSDEKNQEDYPHETEYDVLIIEALFNLSKGFEITFCEDPKRDNKFKEAMNNISKNIKRHLEAFKTTDPTASSPFFVSRMAYDYSGIEKSLSNQDQKINNNSW